MKKLSSVKTIILAVNPLLQLNTLCLRSRGAVRKPRRAALCLAALIAGLGLIPAGRVTAQTFTVLHSFTSPVYGYGTNSDGAKPSGRLIASLSGNTLYGTAYIGGSMGHGAVFTVNTDGTGFTILHNFNFFADGSQPPDGVVLSGNTLYGTAAYGGSSGNGTVFKVNTDGTGFTALHHFTGDPSDGARPGAGVILSSNGNTLYGTTYLGGSSGNGTVFKININGTGFTILHHFTATFDPYYTNGDGAFPSKSLVLSGNTLYGTAGTAGSLHNGTVFMVNTDGTGFTILHSFTPALFDPVNNPSSTNSDGTSPQSLMLSGNILYGTTAGGGGLGNGTVFALDTNGTGFTTLHSFDYYSDGRGVPAPLILSGNTLYETAGNGGSAGEGTVFALNTDGTGFMTLHSFDYEGDGGASPSGLILSGNTLYGPAGDGGSLHNGTVFSLSFAPQLTIIPSGANVVLTWPTNFVGFDYTGFTLQSTTNLLPTAWSPVAQSAVTNSGQISVTVPTAVGRKFFRLQSL